MYSQKPLAVGKIALLVEYDGAAYSGWQKQQSPALPTVQQAVEEAIAYVANHPVVIHCAGRTDARVHASAQLVHFESQVERSEKAWVCGVNANLPDDIVIKRAVAVNDDFHARFSATARVYRYIIANQAYRSAVMNNKVTWVDSPLCAEKMHKAAQHLLGENDFSSFRGAGCQSNTPMRFMEYIKVWRQGDLIVTEICANAFLLHMVRNIMGVLIEVGAGRQSIDWVAEVLAAKDRRQAAVTAKPDGLYLVNVRYPEVCGLPQLPFGPLFVSE